MQTLNFVLSNGFLFFVTFYHTVHTAVQFVSFTGPPLRDWIERHERPCKIYKQCNRKYVNMFCAFNNVFSILYEHKTGGCVLP